MLRAQTNLVGSREGATARKCNGCSRKEKESNYRAAHKTSCFDSKLTLR